jgi:hypothetical protein
MLNKEIGDKKKDLRDLREKLEQIKREGDLSNPETKKLVEELE